MTRHSHSRRRSALIVAALLVMTTLAPASSAVAADPPESGIVCIPGAPSFTLDATAGYVQIPDGNTIYMWSYTGNGSFQLPGPTLCVNSGDSVSVTLVNHLPEDVSIMFTGQSGVLAGGAPAQPQFDGSTLTSLVQPAGAGGGTMTYTFTANEPGTYIYESGTDPTKQVPMGLYGALIVRPVGHSDWAYNDATIDLATGNPNPRTQFNPNAEFLMLLSEIDPDLHQAVERHLPYDWAAYHPRYWMINGRSFPDTIAPNGAPWLPNQPYSALIHIPVKEHDTDAPALLRYLNVGTLNHPFHPHGQNALVIGRDGRELIGAGGEDLSYQKFTVLVGAGQTLDSTYEFSDVEMWQPNTNPIPVTLPQLQNLTFKDAATWYSGSPYLGVQDEFPTGVTSYNQCGEFYHVAHSHALKEAANYDAGFGGMLTLIRIDPPGHFNCQ